MTLWLPVCFYGQKKSSKLGSSNQSPTRQKFFTYKWTPNRKGRQERQSCFPWKWIHTPYLRYLSVAMMVVWMITVKYLLIFSSCFLACFFRIMFSSDKRKYLSSSSSRLHLPTIRLCWAALCSRPTKNINFPEHEIQNKSCHLTV